MTPQGYHQPPCAHNAQPATEYADPLLVVALTDCLERLVAAQDAASRDTCATPLDSPSRALDEFGPAEREAARRQWPSAAVRAALETQCEALGDDELVAIERLHGLVATTLRDAARAVLERRKALATDLPPIRPPCPICGVRMEPVFTGDWICLTEHDSPRFFFAKEVAA